MSRLASRNGQARLADRAYARLRRDILRCQPPPGQAVSEPQLSARYRFGRAAVRSALVRLAQDGLVAPIPRRGYVVAPLTLADVHDIFELRLLLEPAAARRAAGRVDGARLRRLDALCRAGYVPGDRASTAAFVRANREFHVTIARASGNERLAGALADLLDQMERLFHLGLARRDRTLEMQHEHQALVEALTAGDGPAAERIAAAQIEAARAMVVDALVGDRTEPVSRVAS